MRANTNGDRLGSLNRTGAKGLLLRRIERGKEGGDGRGASLSVARSVGGLKGDFRKEPSAIQREATCKSKMYLQSSTKELALG